jgi:hypothetical protein
VAGAALLLLLVPAPGKPPRAPAPARLGSVTPCLLRQVRNAVRVVDLLLFAVVVALVVDEAFELPPQAAMQIAAITASNVIPVPRRTPDKRFNGIPVLSNFMVLSSRRAS